MFGELFMLSKRFQCRRRNKLSSKLGVTVPTFYLEEFYALACLPTALVPSLIALSSKTLI
jgi:hypothetical protein